MPDRAVVASELEQIADHFRLCANSSPDIGFEEYEQAVMDAIALLREQEPVKPIEEGSVQYRWFRCGKCAEPLYGPWNYCPKCGRKVRWDE